jgi:hypothetical protein
VDRAQPAASVPRVVAAGAALLAACLCAGPARSDPLGLRLEAGYRYSDNVTRAPQGSPDVLNDQSLGLTLGKNFNLPLTERTRLVVNAFVGGEKFQNYDGLSYLTYGLQGSWQFRPSGSFGAPTWSVFARAAGEQFQSSLRDGYRISVGASVRKPLTDRIQVSVAATYNVRNASSTAFDTTDGAVRANLDYTLFGRDTLYFGGEYRRGDTVSTNRSSPALAGIAKAKALDDAFDNSIARWAYRFAGRTLVGTAGYNLAFAPGQSLDFAYRYVRSTPTEFIAYPNPNWAQPTRYVDHQFGVAYLIRF